MKRLFRNKKKKEEKQENLPAIQTSYTFIQIGDNCEITVNKLSIRKTKQELEELKIYDRIVNKTISDNDLEEVLRKHEISKIPGILTKQEEDKFSKLLVKKDGHYYREPFPISVPKAMANYYADISQDNIKALDWFWFWCNLNENQQAARDLFAFIKANGLLITSYGFILAYRRVKLKEAGNKILHDFIAENHAKVKKQKQSPKNYLVVDNSNGDTKFYSLHNTKNKTELASDAKTIGENLDWCYDNISNLTKTVFTDNHTGTFRIHMGVPVVMNRAECDESRAQCSKGLHATSYQALSSYASSFGDSQIAILINPMDVVSVPGDYGGAKMRCCRYIPICTVTTPLHEQDTEVVNIDDKFFTYSKEELKLLAQKMKKAKDTNPVKLLGEGDIDKLQKEVVNVHKRRRKHIIVK